MHGCRFGRCTALLSRNDFPMPLAKEDEGLLASWLANQSQIRTAAVVAQCWQRKRIACVGKPLNTGSICAWDVGCTDGGPEGRSESALQEVQKSKHGTHSV